MVIYQRNKLILIEEFDDKCSCLESNQKRSLNDIESAVTLVEKFPHQSTTFKRNIIAYYLFSPGWVTTII